MMTSRWIVGLRMTISFLSPMIADMTGVNLGLPELRKLDQGGVPLHVVGKPGGLLLQNLEKLG